MMYGHGEGVAKDSREAAAWFRKAAEQGDATAQAMLSIYYLKGEGVPRNYGEAFKWFRLYGFRKITRLWATPSPIAEAQKLASETTTTQQPTASSTNAPKVLPMSLAGVELGGRCKKAGTKQFKEVVCGTTSDNRVIWISAWYTFEALSGVTYDDLVSARTGKYGAPTKTSTDPNESCTPGGMVWPATRARCAIWEDSATRLTLYYFLNPNVSYSERHYVTLQSKVLQAEHNAAEASREAAQQKRGEKKASGLLQDE